MASTKTQSPAKATNVATIVEVEVFLNIQGATSEVVISVPDNTFRGPGPGDIRLDSGLWTLNFNITNDDGTTFAEGPFMIGPENPVSSPPSPVTFTTARTSPTRLAISFEFTTANFENFQYVLRLLDIAGNIHIKDPKVIHRGTPLENKVPPLVD